MYNLQQTDEELKAQIQFQNQQSFKRYLAILPESKSNQKLIKIPPVHNLTSTRHLKGDELPYREHDYEQEDKSVWGIVKPAKDIDYKVHESARCTMLQENNLDDPERVMRCSKIHECHYVGDGKVQTSFDNEKCDAWSSCGRWIVTGNDEDNKTEYTSCILSKYCDIEANYDGRPTNYTCPQGVKDSPIREERHHAFPLTEQETQQEYMDFQNKFYRVDKEHGPLHYRPYPGGLKFPVYETNTIKPGFKIWVDGGVLDYE